jgi:IS6 family transposase
MAGFFRCEIIPSAVQCSCKFGFSHRIPEEILEERGVGVDHTTLCRWVPHYAPEIEKRLQLHWKRRSIDRSWRVGETGVKVKG